jgi:hypothetical protein
MRQAQAERPGMRRAQASLGRGRSIRMLDIRLAIARILAAPAASAASAAAGIVTGRLIREDLDHQVLASERHD